VPFTFPIVGAAGVLVGSKLKRRGWLSWSEEVDSNWTARRITSPLGHRSRLRRPMCGGGSALPEAHIPTISGLRP